VLWSEIAEFSVDAGDMKQAENANQNALVFFQQIRSKRGEAITLRNLGGIEFVYGNITKSEALIRRALDIFREIEDGINTIWSSDSLARTLIEKDNLEEAKKILLDIEPIAIQMNEVGFLPEIYIHLSAISLFENKTNDAIQYALRATQIVADDDQYSRPRSYCAVVKALMAVDDLDEAAKYMDVALKMVENTSYIYVKAHVNFEYAKFLVRKGPAVNQAKKMCSDAKELFVKIEARREINKIISFESSLSTA
jgi:tetratricopeptide (TPR) repeat protein